MYGCFNTKIKCSLAISTSSCPLIFKSYENNIPFFVSAGGVFSSHDLLIKEFRLERNVTIISNYCEKAHC